VPCPNQNSCETISLDRPTPPPALHMHIKDIEDVTVGLYLQSDTIWFLPALESSLLSARNVELPSPYVLASDQTVLPPWRPARGSGFFKSNRYPVIVLKSHMLLEAFMRLYVRDLNKRIGLFALAMVGYMMMYVEEDGFLDAQLLPEPLRTSYENLKKGRKPVRQWSKELVEALGTSGQGF
jgi:hypothetical protein